MLKKGTDRDEQCFALAAQAIFDHALTDKLLIFPCDVFSTAEAASGEAAPSARGLV